MKKRNPAYTQAIMITLIVVALIAVFSAARSVDTSKELVSGMQDMKEMLQKQDSTISRQNRLIERQSEEIGELKFTLKELENSNEVYKKELDSTRSVLNYVRRHYVPAKQYERYSPN